MLGFIAEKLGEATRFVVETAEDFYEETASMSDRFMKGYNGQSTPTPIEKTDDYEIATEFSRKTALENDESEKTQGEQNVAS